MPNRGTDPAAQSAGILSPSAERRCRQSGILSRAILTESPPQGVTMAGRTVAPGCGARKPTWDRKRLGIAGVADNRLAGEGLGCLRGNGRVDGAGAGALPARDRARQRRELA